MTKEAVTTYTMQITQANSSKLLCIAYSIWLDFAHDVTTYYEKQDFDAYKQSLKKLQKVNQEIINMLSRENAVAQDVKTIHFFANRKIVDSILKKEPVELDRLIVMMEKLKLAFEEISKQDFDEPLMQNTQQVYAGLTYGRGTLNESMDPMGQSNRGYTV